MQFFEFSQAWDQFMKDYEATAYLSLDKLKERHKKELEDITQVPLKLKFSWKVLDLRWRIDALTVQRKYEDANKLKAYVEQLEDDEKD